MIGRVAADAGSARRTQSAAARCPIMARHLNPGPPPMPQLEPIPCLVLITVNVLLALVSLVALTGIWFGSPIGAVAQVSPR